MQLKKIFNTCLLPPKGKRTYAHLFLVGGSEQGIFCFLSFGSKFWDEITLNSNIFGEHSLYFSLSHVYVYVYVFASVHAFTSGALRWVLEGFLNHTPSYSLKQGSSVEFTACLHDFCDWASFLGMSCLHLPRTGISYMLSGLTRICKGLGIWILVSVPSHKGL